MRPVSHRLDFGIETFVFVVADYADNFRRVISVFHVNRDSLAYWILAWQILASECLVNDYDVASLISLIGARKAAALERNLHRLKVVCIGDANAGAQFLARRQWWLAFDFESKYLSEDRRREGN